MKTKSEREKKEMKEKMAKACCISWRMPLLNLFTLKSRKEEKKGNI